MPLPKHQTIQLPANERILEQISELQEHIQEETGIPGVRIPKWSAVQVAVKEALASRSTPE